jgi:ABC-type nitrate/sulfonate/bicarbonate transport system permease component
VPVLDSVTLIRIAIVLVILTVWEVVAGSGLLYRDVVPSLVRIAEALARILSGSDFYANLGVTAVEIAIAMAFGGSSGLATGLMLGSSRFVSKAYEPYLYYLAPTPKIIFFPVMIMWFGVGVGSKIAMGSLSCYFPVALSVAAGMRGIDDVLIRVGRSFRASTWQMVTKVYMPAMRAPIINGVRLGFGVAVIGVLLAETKLSNQGLGYLIMQSFTLFNMAQMYALLIIVFTIAIGANALLARLSGADVTAR